MQGEKRFSFDGIDYNRKLQYHSQMGAMAATPDYRTVGLKQFDLWNAMFPTSFEGVKNPTVSETSAQRIGTVFTCLNILGETIGYLPFSVKKNTDNGAVTDYKNPVHRLIHDRPNAHMTAFDFWSATEKLRRAWGDAYAEIIRDKNFIPSSLEIRLKSDVEIKLTQSGELYYLYKGRIIRATDMLHFKNYTLDGICGISSIRQNQLTLGIALKLDQYNSSIIGERPYGYLTSPPGVKPKDLQGKANMRSMWDKRNTDQDEKDEKQTPTNLNGIPYLYGGMEFKSFTLPADDVAYIESAKLKNQDIYGIFRIPPSIAENWENAPYNSSEQQDIHFVKYTLSSSKVYEQECTEKLFAESNKVSNQFYCRFSFNGLLRGDMNTRKEFYASGIQNSWLTPNQVCEFEELPTYGKPGDQHFINAAVVPVEQLADFVKAKLTTPNGQTREQIISELREKFKAKLNGHYADIAEYLN